MYNDHILSRLADSYQAEKVARAERARLLKQARSGRPILRHRLLAWSGDRLIIFGRALKERYEPGALPTIAELTADNR
jgi:hypothetical protein